MTEDRPRSIYATHITSSTTYSERYVCTRCGIDRTTHTGRPSRTGMCRDCLHLPDTHNPPALPAGEWVRRGMVKVWRPYNPHTQIVATAIHRITTNILTETAPPPPTTLCPADGCLLIGNEPCPACETRQQTTEEAA